MRQTLIANEHIYVQDEDGLWRMMTITPTVGGAWASFGEPQTLETILGHETGLFMDELSTILSGIADRACVQADDDTPAEDLREADVKGADLLKGLGRTDEG